MPCHTRSMAETLGKTPPESKYSPNMTLHFAYGTNPNLLKENLDNVNNL